MFAVVGWCESDNIRCKMCMESMHDLYSLSKTRSPSGEEFVLRTKTELRVCMRCSNVYGGAIDDFTGTVTVNMPLKDFLEAAVAFSVMKK